MTTQQFLTNLEKVLRAGDGWSARCPAHEDRRQSLSVSTGDDGRVLLNCHAGCDAQAIVDAMDLSLADLFPDQPDMETPRAATRDASDKRTSFDNTKSTRSNANGKARRKPVAEYDYRDESGKLLYQVCRFAHKDFRQRRPDGNGDWVWKLGDVRRVLYRLPELGKSNKGVIVVEGEKDADRLASQGFVATCNMGGAGKWRDEYNESLRGRDVVVLPDNDDPGRKHAQQVAAALHGVAKRVRVVELSGLPAKGDLSDWLDAGGTAERLRHLINDAPMWEPPADATCIASAANDAKVLKQRWPSPIARSAFHGLAGNVVRAIEPHTEADTAALLFQFLAVFGTVVGRGPHQQVEADRHGTNLFVALVGESARGRKGTSFGHIRRLFKQVDQAWINNGLKSGLSSGEGLIWAVRDPIEVQQPIKEHGRTVDYETVTQDPGIQDKRLLAMEPELASTLRVLGREGNTLSAQIRQAWDSGILRVLTKKSPAQATDTHISLIGHITRDELRRYLDSTEAANGFANRFLWVCVKRSKHLPHGGEFWDSDRSDLVGQIRSAVEFSRPNRRFKMSTGARDYWAALYVGELGNEIPGLVGAVTARAEAQTLRLSTIYAALDRSETVEPEHIQAALAVWRYSLASARYIFGNATGDPLVDELLLFIQQAGPHGVSRTDISNHLKRHKSASQITRALSELRGAGRVDRRQEKTNGRDVERWFSIQPDACEKSETCERGARTEVGHSGHATLSSLNSLNSQGQPEKNDASWSEVL